MKSGSYELVELLLELGAKPIPHTENGLTPLHLACETGSVELVNMLMKVSSLIIDSSNKYWPIKTWNWISLFCILMKVDSVADPGEGEFSPLKGWLDPSLNFWTIDIFKIVDPPFKLHNYDDHLIQHTVC